MGYQILQKILRENFHPGLVFEVKQLIPLVNLMSIPTVQVLRLVEHGLVQDETLDDVAQHTLPQLLVKAHQILDVDLRDLLSILLALLDDILVQEQVLRQHSICHTLVEQPLHFKV